MNALGFTRSVLLFCPVLLLAPAGAGPKSTLPAPRDCTASIFRSFTVEVTIDWTDTSDNEDGFTVEYSSSTFQSTWNVPADSTSLTLEFFSIPADGLEGSFRVRAFNASSVSKWSNKARLSDRHGGGVTGNG